MKNVKAGWTDVVLVCRRCSKKLAGGFGETGDQRLAKALRRATRSAGTASKARRRRIGILEVGCLDVCPKGAVLALRAGAPGEWLVVPAGTPIALVAASLGLGGPTGDE